MITEMDLRCILQRNSTLHVTLYNSTEDAPFVLDKGERKEKS